jgi:hypothetical protein
METKYIKIRAQKQLQFFLFGASILSGLLAGETFDRLVIGLRAWKYVDISSWANYSRHADLGNGIFVYPFEAIGSVILLMTASVIILRLTNRYNLKFPTIQIYLATILSLLGLLFTFFAGPYMLSIRNISDPSILQNAFNEFYYWSTFRGIAHISSFVFCIWGFIKILSSMNFHYS